MQFKKQLITPLIAKELLGANIKNRRVKTPVVLRYAQDIKSGRWKDDTAEMIKVSKTGILIDGQHRLMAVIKANKPVNFYVAFGIDESVTDVLDTGSGRNASDAFKIEGIKNDNVIPSIISTYHHLRNGTMVRGAAINSRLTNSELLIEYFEREDFWQGVAYKSLSWYNVFAKILPPSIIGGTFAFLTKINGDDAEKFMEQLATGIGISNNIIALLRQKLMQDKMAIRKMPPTMRQALIIKAWNIFRKRNLNSKILRISIEKEGFPLAI